MARELTMVLHVNRKQPLYYRGVIQGTNNRNKADNINNYKAKSGVFVCVYARTRKVGKKLLDQNLLYYF